MLNFQIENQKNTTQPVDVVLAVDNSSSIKNWSEKTPSSIDEFLIGLENTFAENDKFQLYTYQFGSDFKTKDSLNFDDQQTKISEALTNIAEIHSSRNTPVVLVSDGNQTYGTDYVQLSKQKKLDVIPVIVGDTTAQMDTKIDQINHNNYTFLNNKFPIEIFVSATSGTKFSTEVQLKKNDQVVQRKPVEFDKNNLAHRVQFLVQAKAVGTHNYTVELQPDSTEKNKLNNTEQIGIEVIDERTKVLVLSSVLHPDLGKLKKTIESNEQREVDIQLITDFNGDFEAVNLLILYQPNDSFETVYQQLESIDLNTFTITGTKTDYRFLNRVEPDFEKEITSANEDFSPLYNKNYSAFQFEDIQFSEFPPLQDQFGDVEINTAHQNLLYQKIQGVDTENPLLFTYQKSMTKNAYLLGENSWRWRAESYLLNENFKEYDDFFGKLIQFLSAQNSNKRLLLDYNSFYKLGQNKRLYATYYDANFNFDPRADLTLKFTNKDTGEESTYPMLLKGNRFGFNLDVLDPGTYDFSVGVEGENRTENGSFTIVSYDVEAQFVNANSDKFKEFNHPIFSISQQDSLANYIQNQSKFKPVQKSTKKTQSLIDWVFLLGLLILTLSVEWFLRKYHGLI
ncbi:MAG: vWA domain-containing protein [Bacteroidota bacterium]